MYKCWYENVCSENCNNSCIRYLEMLNLVKLSGIPENKWYPDALYPEPRDKESFIFLRDYKDNISQHIKNGDNLLICSNKTGNGKTSWSIKILLKYFNDIWAGNGFRCRGLFINIPTFLNTLKSNMTYRDEKFTEILDLIPKVDLVVWDDIASTKMSDYDLTQLLTLIDQRTLNGKSNIYTSNITDTKTLQEILGMRIASRVLNSEIVNINGEDRRIRR